MARKQRQIRKTLLAVGEGETEVAFLGYLRELYCADGEGVNVTIRNARGKGPEHVLEHAIGQCRSVDYDKRLAFLDTDIPWTPALVRKARAARIELLGSTPCIEGLLLAILGKSASATSTECKRRLQKSLGMDMTERAHYRSHFSRDVLEVARLKIPTLNSLLSRYEGS